MKIEENYFGLVDDKTVFTYSMSNNNGIKAVLTNYGATLVNLYIPCKNKKIDVVLGYDNLENYMINPKFFGATIGPNCNRISKGEISLGNKQYNLEQNDNENNLHSGEKGFHNVIWDVSINEDENYVEFYHYNLDEEQGFPGNSKIKVKYKLTEKNELVISYEGLSDKDTIMNLTNHTYFNLSGHSNKDATNQELWLKSKYFTPVKDSKSIPTGEIKSVKDTPMDFTTTKKIKSQINEKYGQLEFCGGYDHNFIIDKEKEGIEKIAKLSDENTNITMEVYSDTPGVQFYTGNFISGGPVGKENIVYEDRCGVCLETQFFPNSINIKNFKSPILKAGDKYESMTIYKFVY
ncbi:MAG: aldose epimerase family protein [Terrisporobacter sp.]|uniref:aldose epimerase family protein n=1 Tax=Terrisporobacter sp. TaxID=1965305 RepID=UPI002FC83FD9